MFIERALEKEHSIRMLAIDISLLMERWARADYD